MNETLTAIFKAVDQISPVVKQIEANTSKLEGQVSSMAGKFSTAYKVIGSTAAFAAVVKGIGMVVDAADEIDTFAGRIDDTAENIQKLQAISIEFDTEMGALVSGIQTLQERLASGKLDEPLAKIGVEVAKLRGLGGVDLYVAIAEALASIEDPAERAAAAKQLLGNNAKALAGTFRENVSETDAWIKASHNSVAATDALGTAWSKAKQSAKSFGIELLTLVTGAKAYVELRQRYQDYFDKPILPSVKGANITAEPLKPLGFDEKEFAKIEAALTKTAEVAITKNKEVAKSTQEAADAQKRWTESVKFFTVYGAPPFVRGIEDMGDALQNIAAGLNGDGSLRSGTLQGLAEAQKAAEQWAITNGAVLAPSLKDTGTAIEAVTTQTSKFRDAVGNLGTVILSAFTGGGNVLKSIGASLGKGLGEDVVSHFGKAITGKLGETVGTWINSIIPGLGAIAGSLLGKVGDGFKKLFGIGVNNEVKKWNGEIDKLRQGLLSSHGDLEKLEAAANRVGLSFKAAWGHQNKAGLEAFSGLIKDFEERTARLNAATEKYGLTWRDLSEDAQKSQLVEISKNLLGEWELLVQAGYRVERVGEAMQGAINEFLADALRVGAEVPASMKPMLEKMLEMGLLTDENGEKLTDLSRITWAETMTQGFDRVVGAVERLIDVIGGIPRNIDVNVNGHYNPPDIPSGEPASFDVGTYGRLGQFFGNFGSGTPAMLHGREAVITPEQVPAFVAAMGGGSDPEIKRMIRDLPRAIGVAIHDAVVLAPRKRFA